MLYGPAKENFEHLVSPESVDGSIEQCFVCKKPMLMSAAQPVIIRSQIFNAYFCQDCNNFPERKIPWKCTKREPQTPAFQGISLSNPKAQLLHELVPLQRMGEETFEAFIKYAIAVEDSDMHAKACLLYTSPSPRD